MKRNWFLAVIAALATSFALPAAQAASITDGDFSAGGVTEVPPGWTANAAYLSEPGFNTVTANPAFVPPGSSVALSIANFNSESIPVLSQVIATTAGASYTISFQAFAPTSDSASHLYVYIDTSFASGANATPVGGSGLTVSGTLPYTLESFSFIGTGSDTLSIAAYNNPAEYYVANFAIAGGVPEASSWAMMIAGFACLGFVATRAGRARSIRLA